MSDSTNNATIGNAITILSGFPFPSAQFTDRSAKPLIRIRDLLAGRTETNFEGDFDPVFLVHRDDVLIGMDGDFNVVRWKGPEALLNQRVCKVNSASEKIDERFLYWWLKPHVETIHRRTPQTTVRHLSVGDLYRIPKPSLTSSVQAVAAAVLDTVDEAIAKTEAVIAKLKQVRAGVLHDLLTRGLDENGELRDPERHSEQFQDSPLGRIPRDWRVCGVLDLGPFDRQAILTGPFGAQLGQRDFVADGIPVLRIGNVQSGYIDWSDVQYVSRTKAIELKRFSVLPGDLLFARQGATTGRNALADEKAAGALINYHIIRVAVDRDLCEPVFLHAIFNSEQTLRQVNRDKGRGTREGMNTEQISSLRFALPPIEEQRRAVAVLANHDANEHCETALLAKLSQLKSGLMSDLLTGRVLVPESVLAVENQP